MSCTNASSEAVGVASQLTVPILQLSRPLYGDSFYSAYDRLVTCGILRRSIGRNNGNTMLQLMSQEWHLRAAFDGNSLLHQLYDRFRDMLNPFEWV